MVQINYTPITQIYLESIYKFATFKMIPPELMKWFTDIFSSDPEKAEAAVEQQRRYLQAKQDHNIFEDLNGILLGIVFIVLTCILVLCIKLLIAGQSKFIIKKLKPKLTSL